VIATAGVDAKLDQARQLGADYGINYTRGNFATQVRHMTNNRGVDVVVDTVGGETFRRSLECLAVGGRLILVGTVGGSTVDVELQYLVSRGINVMGLNASTLPPYQAADRFRQIYDLVASNRLHAVIDRVLSLADAPLAHKLLATRSHFGKIVLRT
jgi:NADPH:quinone reductase-like Zn-dependent oxidoreductase